MLFGLLRVPTDAQTRNVLDLIPAAQFNGIFDLGVMVILMNAQAQKTETTA